MYGELMVLPFRLEPREMSSRGNYTPAQLQGAGAGSAQKARGKLVGQDPALEKDVVELSCKYPAFVVFCFCLDM